MASLLLVVALIALALALWLRRLARRGREAVGLPAGRVVYVDDRAWRRPPAPLYSATYGLTGRPDYLVRQGQALIPVEVKPSRRAASPYLADRLQLAAYCLLIEGTTGVTPPHGLLRYSEHTFELPYDDVVRQWLLEVLEQMRLDAEADDVPRSHNDPARCAACGMRVHCGEESLV